MEIELTPEQGDFIRLAVSDGRFEQPAQAVHEALALWVERERQRVDLLASLDLAENAIAQGEGVSITPERMTELARSVVERCRERLEKRRVLVT